MQLYLAIPFLLLRSLLSLTFIFLGAFVAHGANMLLSYGWSSNQTNECLLYLVNFSTDCIFGVAINVIILKFSIHVAEKYFESDALESGEYGSPFEWSRWLTQCAFWIAVVLLGKIVLVVALVLPFKDPLYTITDFIFSPLHRYPHVQLVLVMVVIPLFLNAATFWIQDAYLMKPLVPTTSSVSGMYVDDYFIGGSMGGVDEDGYGEGNDIHQPILKDVDS